MKAFLNTPSGAFAILTAAVAVFLLGPALVQDGMFMDGVLYASVSNNMANGLGSFWFPHFSKTAATFFHQQPPLMFFIQSLFFRALGDSIYVERVYSFIITLITVFLIDRIWKEVFKNEPSHKPNSWFVILLWITIPCVFWSYSNNLEEITMGIFTLSSLWMIVRYLFNDEKTMWLILAGGLLVIASLCKGFPGLYPLAAPFVYCLAQGKGNLMKGLKESIIITGAVLFLFAVILLFEQPRTSLWAYMNDRVLNSIKNVSNVDSRFYMIERMIMEPLSVFIVGGLVWTYAFIKKKSEQLKPFTKRATAFFILGLCGCVPLIITKEQRPFYMLTAFPCFALAVGVYFAPIISETLSKISQRKGMLIKVLGIILIVAGIVFSFFHVGKTQRDQDKLQDIYAFGKIVPRGEIVKIANELQEDWALQNYLVRHFYISVSPYVTNVNYLITPAEAPIVEGYTLVDGPTNVYRLLKKHHAKSSNK